MKNHLLLSAFLAIFAVLAAPADSVAANAPAAPNAPRAGLIPDKNMAHIGIVVRDIEAAREHWAKFLGVTELPPIRVAAGHEANPTRFHGHPSNAKAKLAFFRLDNMQVELIEPLADDPSHWREFLDTKGEGVHHIAFWVKGLGEQYIETFAAAGMPAQQQGGWDGGEYAYMGTAEALGVTVELLENYRK